MELSIRNRKEKILIDNEDYELVKNYVWSITNKYAASRTNGKFIYLHVLLMGKRNGFEIDHINRNKLDNRRENLRFVNHRINCLNTDALGIYWSKQRKKWIAQITYKYKNINLGGFIDFNEALKVRKMVKNLYGQRK